MSVEIEGEQLTDGTVERCILLNFGPDDQSIEITEQAWGALELELDADAARRLAAALAEAADEVERLARP